MSATSTDIFPTTSNASNSQLDVDTRPYSVRLAEEVLEVYLILSRGTPFVDVETDLAAAIDLVKFAHSLKEEA